MKLIILLSLVLTNMSVLAQTDSTINMQDTTTSDTTIHLSSDTATIIQANSLSVISNEKSKLKYSKNVVKFNLGSLLLFNNYNFVYERSLSRKFTASIGYRTMQPTPLSILPALEKGFNMAGKDESELEDGWDDIRVSNQTYTAEIRFYGGKKPGPRGFYFGLFGRYATFDVDYDYKYRNIYGDYPIPITSTTKGIGGGLLIGVQWLIGKRVAVDWQILGGQWGKLTGEGHGIADLSELSPEDRGYVRNDLEGMLPSISDKNMIDARVNNSGVVLAIDGPFAGIRSAINLGISF